MTLLDRFRTQPQRQADPAARLAYVGEIPLTARDVIAAIAREDEDPRVRRAAVAKLMDPGALGAISRDDRDESVRAEAVGMLRDIALEMFEGLGEHDSLEAVDALSDLRTLAQIAKTAGREIVALRALSGISEVHSLGSIARHAASEAARRGAFERLRADAAEILAVALNSEYKDTALAAVDLVADREALEQIAARGKNKSAAKRARAIVREAEEREAAGREDAQGEAAELTAADREDGDKDAPRADPAPEEAVVQNPLAAAEAEQARVEVERVRAEAAAATAERRRRESEEAAEHERLRSAADEEARRMLTERRHVRLTELIESAASVATGADIAAARKSFGLIRREWKDLVTGIVVDETLAVRFVEIEAQLTTREVQAREADARARREALARLQQLAGRVEPLAARADLSLKAADRALRDVRMALATMPPLPTKQDYDEITRRMKAAQTALTAKAQDLREADDWQRWANVGVQEQLCAKMEALATLEDPEVIAQEVRGLQQQWKQAADVPRAQADALWRRFKTAHDLAWTRCEAHFVAQAEERSANLARKTVLCEQAEALADSTRWIETAEAIKKLQTEWKTIGPVSRGREKAIWDRFRTACDRFFTRRHEDLDRLKKVWAENLARKEALCARAESLAESTDWDGTAAEFRKLQVEWKAIGPVKKSRSESIWQRFRGACDRFFSRHAQRHDITRAERVAAREAICVELEALARPSDPDGEVASVPPADLLQTVRVLRGKWQQEIAARGVDPDRARALDERFAVAFAGVRARWSAAFSGTDLDPDANQKRMEAIVRRIEDLAGSLAGPAPAGDAELTPAMRLATMLKEALAANTIGGKVDDDSRWRAAAEEVRQAQASLSRIGHVPEPTRHALVVRFQRASRRITERAAGTRVSTPSESGGGGWSGRSGH